jgi:hypothetical protein
MPVKGSDTSSVTQILLCAIIIVLHAAQDQRPTELGEISFG